MFTPASLRHMWHSCAGVEICTFLTRTMNVIFTSDESFFRTGPEIRILPWEMTFPMLLWWYLLQNASFYHLMGVISGFFYYMLQIVVDGQHSSRFFFVINFQFAAEVPEVQTSQEQMKCWRIQIHKMLMGFLLQSGYTDRGGWMRTWQLMLLQRRWLYLPW